MTLSGARLATLIVSIILLTLLVTFGLTTLALWLMGDWDDHSYGLTLTLKIMWGTWLILFAAAILTWVTFYGWRFRKLRPGEGPRALVKAMAAQIKPASLFKSGASSFTVTVVLVSLFGTAVLASVLLWIIGDWYPAKSVALKAIWGAWWVLCIGTVLVRIALFTKARRLAKQARAEIESKNGKEYPPTATEQEKEKSS